jgi:hypothetical protein
MTDDAQQNDADECEPVAPECSCGLPVSTVAMTAYNWLATQAGARTLDELLEGARSWNKLITSVDIRRAVTALVTRQLFTQDGALYNLRDKKRRVVVSRDRTDPLGWLGWRVAKKPLQLTAPIESTLEN